jgi:3-oxoacyl-[acyl-carrier-protein] synthase II
MNDRPRVVVTGIGVLSPLGNSMDALSAAIRAQKSGIRQMPEWDGIENLRCKVAGICKDFHEKQIPRQYRRTMGRVGILASIAALQAVADSGLSETETASTQCGISFGSTEGSTTSMEIFFQQASTNRSLKGMQSSSYLQFMSHTCAANLAILFQAKGPLIASCTACVSGSQGIGFGYEAIKQGKAAMMITGGAEEMHFMNAGVFDIMRTTSTGFNDSPEKTPRPFDRDRDGLVVSEGGACLVLEELNHARKRNARIYAEVLGFGNNCDGSHLTSPGVDGLVGASQIALKEAGLGPEQIGHINAHATATEAGDIAESQAIYRVFGDRVPVTGFKGYLGHTLGACGAIESIITIAMMRENYMAPTRNLVMPDPACAPIQYIQGDVREASFSIGMNNNFAFGGINTSLIFSKW